jgi:hypothetical protein
LIAFGMAAGADALIDTPWRPVRLAGWVLAYLLMGETLRHFDEGGDLLKPRRVHQLKPVLAYVSDRLEPGDALFVNGLAVSTFRFYTESTSEFPGFAGHETVFGPHQDLYAATPEENLDRLMRHPRAWMIYTYIDKKGRARLRRLEAAGRLLDLRVEPSAGAMLFDFRQPPRNAPDAGPSATESASQG